MKYIGNRSNIGYTRVKSITKNLPRKERSSCVILHQYTFEKIICPRCFSDHLYLYGHDKHGNQKYKCRNCNRQFSPASKRTSSQSKYPKCPLCGKATFIWHRYDTYLHFKCGSKTCNHSFKIPIPPPSLLLLPQNLDGVTSFSGFRTPPFLIFIALSLYYDANISTRAIKRFLLNCFNFSISHVAIHYWTKAFAPWFLIVSKLYYPALDLNSDTWHADETFIKINGIEHYLWILIDSETRFVISFVLSDKRDSNSAFLLFHRAKCLTHARPLCIVTDHWDAYNQAIATLYPSVTHHQYDTFSDDVSNNVIEAFNHTFKAWYRTKKGLKSFVDYGFLISLQFPASAYFFESAFSCSSCWRFLFSYANAFLVTFLKKFFFSSRAFLCLFSFCIFIDAYSFLFHTFFTEPSLQINFCKIHRQIPLYYLWTYQSIGSKINQLR